MNDKSSFNKSRMKESQRLLDAFIDRQYAERGIGAKFGSPKDEELVKWAACWTLVREVPTYLRLPGRFGSSETLGLLSNTAEQFFEGVMDGTISIMERKEISPDIAPDAVWHIETRSVLETKDGVATELFSEKTARRLKAAKA